MKKIVMFFCVCLVSSLFISCMNKNKFVEENGKTYYYDENSEKTKGWKQIGDNWYYFNESSNEMLIGWKEIEGDWYFFNENGEMQKDSFVENYYVDENGKMVKNQIKTIHNKSYIFNEDGNFAEIPDFTVKVTNSLPEAYSCWYGKVLITSVTNKVIDNKFHLYFSGECGYEYLDAGDGMKPRQVAWRLIDPQGYVVDSGTLTTDKMDMGDKFKDKEVIVGKELNEKGEYKLTLSKLDPNTRPNGVE